MPKDWDAVAQAIDARMRELDLTQTELAVRADVAPETVRELRNNLKPRRRNPRTLTAISGALGWPADQLARILAGEESGQPVAECAASVSAELSDLREFVAGLSERLDSVERRLDTR